MSHSSQPSAAALNLEQLLQSGAAAARSGNRAAARALFLALSREHPEEVRVWLGLAGAAASLDEQRDALRRAVALDPGNERAVAALDRLDAAAVEPAGARPTGLLPETIAPGSVSGPAPVTPDEVATSDSADDEVGPAHAPFPLLNALAMLLILLLLGAVGVILGRNLLNGPGPTAPATPILGGQPAAGAGAQVTSALPTIAPATAASATSVVTGAPATAPASVPSTASTGLATAAAPAITTPPSGSGATPTTQSAPTPTPSTELPLGTIVDHDGWSATLLRPDYAVALDGAIGDLQPAGRFVLAVVAVSNNGPAPRVIPPELFTLVDSAGRAYSPVPGASTAYLALYERGQRGDLALEDVLDPASGMRSVPILFDVPLDATSLRLTMPATGGAGWPIGGGAPTLVGP